jgi:hypothetical protein
LDEMVVAAILKLFPDGTAPDENNYSADGLQYKAPGHELMSGRVLIERKTLNAVDNSQFYAKLAEIAKQQGKPFFGYGRLNFANIIDALPDPEAAGRKMTDFMLNRLNKNVGASRKKFDSHLKHTGKLDCARIVLIMDQSEILMHTDWVEYFIGKLFIKQRSGKFNAGLVDGIIYIKNPKYVLGGKNSYWFKCLIKEEAQGNVRALVLQVSQMIYEHLKLEHFSSFSEKFGKSRYRPLIA